MDEGLTNQTRQDVDLARKENPVAAVDDRGPGSAPATGAAGAAAATAARDALDVNELLKLSPEQLDDVAKELGARLGTAHTRHQHIAYLAQLALSRGATVTA